MKHRLKLSDNRSSSNASLGIATLEKTLTSRQKSESELVPLNSARGIVRPMETLLSLNFNLLTDPNFKNNDDITSENLGSPIKGKLTERRIGIAKTTNRVKSFDKIHITSKPIMVEEKLL